jgi:hypothetical protein
MSAQSWQETLVTQNVDGTALTASTTATSIIHPSAKITLPNNFFSIGKCLKITAQGRISNIATTPGTLTLDIRLGAVIAANGGAMALNTTLKTNVPWWFEMLLTCRSIGSGTSATLMYQGDFMSESVVGSAAGVAGTIMCPASAPAVGTGFDSTSALTVDLFAAWSLSNANSIQTHQYKVESLN